MFELVFKPYGSHALLIEWPQKIDESILNDILSFKIKIKNYYDKSSIQVNHAYNSLLISYENKIDDFEGLSNELKRLYNMVEKTTILETTKWDIPVCYDDTFGIDLNAMSETLGLSVKDIVKRHSESTYLVYFIGFLPGFLYLGGLHPSLHCPRRATPRMKVGKGAVAIGGKQTGIYPIASPGGWHIIGNSPVDLFSPYLERPCPISAGDKVKFRPITKDEYHDIKKQVELDAYVLKNESCND